MLEVESRLKISPKRGRLYPAPATGWNHAWLQAPSWWWRVCWAAEHLLATAHIGPPVVRRLPWREAQNTAWCRHRCHWTCLSTCGWQVNPRGPDKVHRWAPPAQQAVFKQARATLARALSSQSNSLLWVPSKASRSLCRSEQAPRCPQEGCTPPRELQHSSPASALQWFSAGAPEEVYSLISSLQGIGDDGNENKRKLIFLLI